jgi:hypothetical protein
MNSLLNRIAKWFFDRLIERLGLGEIQVAVMDLQPGDIILVKSEKVISAEAWIRLKEDLSEIFPNHLVLALEDTLDLAIVRARAKVKESRSI